MYIHLNLWVACNKITQQISVLVKVQILVTVQTQSVFPVLFNLQLYKLFQ